MSHQLPYGYYAGPARPHAASAYTVQSSKNAWTPCMMVEAEVSPQERVNPTIPQSDPYGVAHFNEGTFYSYETSSQPLAAYGSIPVAPSHINEQHNSASQNNASLSWDSGLSRPRAYNRDLQQYETYRHDDTAEASFHPSPTGYASVVAPQAQRHQSLSPFPQPLVPQVPRRSSTQNLYAMNPQSAANSIEDGVSCPYGCGAVLTGVHAVGNLTRHLKSKACPQSGRQKGDYHCPYHCGKSYARSDGLKVHLRRQHGAPAALKKDASTGDDGGSEDDDE